MNYTDKYRLSPANTGYLIMRTARGPSMIRIPMNMTESESQLRKLAHAYGKLSNGYKELSECMRDQQKWPLCKEFEAMADAALTQACRFEADANAVLDG